MNGPEAGESDKEHGESPERSNEKDSVAEVEKEDHIFGHVFLFTLGHIGSNIL